MRHKLGVILDVDGTLLDTNEARTQAWVEALLAAGHRVPFIEIRARVGLVPGELLLDLIGFGEDTEEGAAITARYHQIFLRRYVTRLVSFYQAPDLLERMVEQGVRLQVASSDPAEVLLPLLQRVSAESLIHRAVCPGKGVERGASTRDLLKTALDRVGVATPSVFLLTDCPTDIDAAKKLGVPSVALLSGGWPASALKGAQAVYRDARDLLRQFDQSPFALELAKSA